MKKLIIRNLDNELDYKIITGENKKDCISKIGIFYAMQEINFLNENEDELDSSDLIFSRQCINNLKSAQTIKEIENIVLELFGETISIEDYEDIKKSNVISNDRSNEL